jgi:hypothetical protein
MSENPEQPVVFACDLTTLTPAQREEHVAISRALFAAVREVRELPSGYALRLPEDSAILAQVVSFITYERLCCPFHGMAVEVEPYGGPIWLLITGANGVKEFLAPEIGSLLNDTVAAAAGLRALPAPTDG